MPIRVLRQRGKWLVKNIATGRVLGKHPNSKKAYAQIAALKHRGVDIEGEGEKENDRKDNVYSNKGRI